MSATKTGRGGRRLQLYTCLATGVWSERTKSESEQTSVSPDKVNNGTAALPGRPAYNTRPLQQLNPMCRRFLHNLLRPQRTLYLSDMRLAQIKHTKARLPDAAADGERQLAV